VEPTENTAKPVTFVYDKVLSSFSYGPDHPMKPARLHRTYQLLDSYGVFNDAGASLVSPQLCTEQAILSFHIPRYVSVVQSLSRGEPVADAHRFNLGPGDNPIFEGMYDAFRWQVSASLTAATLVAEGKVDRVLSIAGGLHHAGPAHASGFCVFNDVVIAILALVESGYRVAYIDIDAHHGDGVQNAFYDSNQVLTISLHEGPTFLFPGTGDESEVGRGEGRGYSINVPLPPYTNDEVYLWAFQQIVPSAIKRFAPDIVVTQAGIDTHYRDPLTHLNLTLNGYLAVLREIMALAPRLIVLGGGGYDLSVVSRGWTLAYVTLLGRESDLLDELPNPYSRIYGSGKLRDPEARALAPDTEEYVWGYVRQKVGHIQEDVLPLLDARMGERDDS